MLPLVLRGRPGGGAAFRDRRRHGTRRRPAGEPESPLRLRDRLFGERRDRGVHAPGPRRRGRPRRHAAGPVGDRGDPGARCRDAGGLPDGLRTLLSTVRAGAMKEKTLRYPGHAEAMRTLRDCGFFEARPIEAGGVSIAPRAVTERLLSRAWKLGERDEEFTILRVAVSGRDAGGTSRRYRFELLDCTDPKTGATSMARATGFPCAVMAAMLARGEYRARACARPSSWRRIAKPPSVSSTPFASADSTGRRTGRMPPQSKIQNPKSKIPVAFTSALRRHKDWKACERRSKHRTCRPESDRAERWRSLRQNPAA